MIAYSMILFLGAILFLALGMAIYKGNTKLIIDYHKTNIKESERAEYGKAFAKGMFVGGASLLISGVTALLGKIAVSSIVLFVGLLVSIMVLVKIQRKYNGGIF